MEIDHVQNHIYSIESILFKSLIHSEPLFYCVSLSRKKISFYESIILIIEIQRRIRRRRRRSKNGLNDSIYNLNFHSK